MHFWVPVFCFLLLTIPAVSQENYQFNRVAIGSALTFGQRYEAGIYFARVIQGGMHKIVKVIKML